MLKKKKKRQIHPLQKKGLCRWKMYCLQQCIAKMSWKKVKWPPLTTPKAAAPEEGAAVVEVKEIEGIKSKKNLRDFARNVIKLLI